MKYVLAAVPFSDNLGDGVIADNLIGFLRRREKTDEVILCDISYRAKVSTFKSKGSSMGYFLLLPSIIRQIVVVFFFLGKYITVGRGYLDSKLSGCDELLIGGGQLISDVDMNFPLKLYFLIKHAEKHNIKASIVSVGVASRWSWLSKKLMKRVLTSKSILKVSVRDELSKKNLANYFDLVDVELLPDPALMSSLLSYNKRSLAGGEHEKRLGLGVANLRGLNYSSDIINIQQDNSIECFCSIVEKSNAINYVVYLFTNGAIEDEVFLHESIIPALNTRGLAFRVIPRCNSSSELVKVILGFDMLISYRLHANIIACGFNIPFFAVGWDNKVVSFFKSQHREDCVFKSLKDLDLSFNRIIGMLQPKIKLDILGVELKYSSFIEADNGH